MELHPLAIIITIGAYFLGSASSAIVISQLFSLPDPRSEGSNNPGATNVLRLSGKKAAAGVLIFDIFKGVLPIILGHISLMTSTGLTLIGLAAVVGHVYPIYYKFKGGKGVATALGVFWGINALLGIFCTVVWLIVLRLFSFSSLSSLIMVAIAPIAALAFLYGSFAVIPLFCITALIAWQHSENIKRLINKTEPKTKFFNKDYNEKAK